MSDRKVIDVSAIKAKNAALTQAEAVKAIKEYAKTKNLDQAGYVLADYALRNSVSALRRLAELEERLESRVRELEERGIKYCGTWQRAMDYERGSVTTHQGSAWVALRATGDEPGTSGDWQLMVKRGRDA